MGTNGELTLIYEFGSLNPYDTFEAAARWSGHLGSWECVLDRGQLTATTGQSFESEAAGRASLEPMLRTWEAAAYLRDQYEIYFRPSRASAEIRDAADRDRIFRRANEAYPAPDPSFTVTPAVEGLLGLIREFIGGAIALPAAVDELVAALKSGAQEAGDGSVAETYNVDQGVVDAITELAGRGAKSLEERQSSYRGPEWQWMQEALRLLTLQVGRRTDGPPQTSLAMADFKTRL